MSIATRTGDGGQTGLLYGGRVSKDDLRCEAYGMVDEVVSALGMVRALEPTLNERIMEIQRDLFVVGAEMATASDSIHLLEKHFSRVSQEMVDKVDAWLAQLEEAVVLPDGFVLPGGNVGAAAVDVARSRLRTAERRAVTVAHQDPAASPLLVHYMNRLSDYLFMLARSLEGDALEPK